MPDGIVPPPVLPIFLCVAEAIGVAACERRLLVSTPGRDARRRGSQTAEAVAAALRVSGRGGCHDECERKREERNKSNHGSDLEQASNLGCKRRATGRPLIYR
jgi:hypothetical protein